MTTLPLTDSDICKAAAERRDLYRLRFRGVGDFMAERIANHYFDADDDGWTQMHYTRLLREVHADLLEAEAAANELHEQLITAMRKKKDRS